MTESVIKQLKANADAGDPLAMRDYAIELLEGKNIPRDLSESMKYFNLLMDKEGRPSHNGSVYISMAKLLYEEDKDNEELKELRDKALERFNASFLYDYAEMLETGEFEEILEKDIEKAKELYKEAAEGGEKRAQKKLEELASL